MSWAAATNLTTNSVLFGGRHKQAQTQYAAGVALATLFFSYSHADEGLRDQLEKHLSALKYQGVIEAWHDRRITPGDNFESKIDSHLDNADIILLLVSSDFLASEYCYQLEMKRAMERHSKGDAVVIPVVLRPCDWHDTPFGKLQALPKDGRPVVLWPNSDEALLDVVRGIRNAVPRQNKVPASQSVSRTAEIPTTAPVLRSSNLRVSKRFSELDRDRFLHEGFDYLAKFFENSLEELVRRNPGIERSFRRIDANRFTAASYRDGEKICECSVFLGGMTGGIAYSMRDDALSGFNESLSVEADDQSLYFKALGMQSSSQSREKLSLQGAAEFYWELFIRRIQ